ncbi:hypothetical protein P692DRAFT_20826896 [Suillus brevipes Sb2]|nr:hypothetical protein P692DRAFT_20826896 [Suillus brevipes Sb2]
MAQAESESGARMRLASAQSPSKNTAVHSRIPIEWTAIFPSDRGMGQDLGTMTAKPFFGVINILVTNFLPYGILGLCNINSYLLCIRWKC